MRNLEKNSTKKEKARGLFEDSDKSVREIAAKLKVDEKTVRNWVKADGWLRKSAENPQPVRIGEAVARVVAQVESAAVSSETSESSSGSSPRAATDIAREFCGTIDVLRAEIDTVVRNLHLLRDIAEADLDDAEEKAAIARRRLIDKVLELPGLVKAANDLAAALSRLADNGPGKKEEAKDRAKAVGTGRFATPQAPKLADTLQ